jgi:hypothetical protein
MWIYWPQCGYIGPDVPDHPDVPTPAEHPYWSRCPGDYRMSLVWPRCEYIPDVRTLRDVPTLSAYQYWPRSPDIGPDVGTMELPDVPTSGPVGDIGACPDNGGRCGYSGPDVWTSPGVGTLPEWVRCHRTHNGPPAYVCCQCTHNGHNGPHKFPARCGAYGRRMRAYSVSGQMRRIRRAGCGAYGPMRRIRLDEAHRSRMRRI